ncbi:MAG: small ribosomal subunit Rsm22 family protein [Actinomycetota bacterium]|nr:small ribosomal subunit Rsm22 family protein [Actinomycetota bacterium]
MTRRAWPYDAAGSSFVVDLPGPLRAALEAELDGLSMRELGRAAEQLSRRYRADQPADLPILGSPLATAAYLTTRMPATYAAVRQVCDRLAAARPDFRPCTMLDLGAGTGAATWAAADAYPSLEVTHLVDSSAPALASARRMLDRSSLRVTYALDRVDQPGSWSSGGGFDLAVCGFLLGELPSASQNAVIAGLARAAQTVAIIEPGTPAGYRRVLAARQELIAAGRHVLAPCPHDLACPLETTQDWCHFAVRLTRSIRHRQAKGGERGYEDEKYAYVVAAAQVPVDRANRILRHPQVRTGHTRLMLCSTAPGIEAVTVSKRHGADYRAARDAGWGDAWPPVPPGS